MADDRPNQKGPNTKKKQKCKNCEGKGLLKKGEKVVKCQVSRDGAEVRSSATSIAMIH